LPGCPPEVGSRIDPATPVGEPFPCQTSAAFKLLHDRFSGEGYTFYFERSKVFLHSARDAAGKVTPSVIGILPSFVPATAADPGHSAVGISVHDSGYAIACSVEVNHNPFGVTDLSLHEIDPAKKTVVTSPVNVTDVATDPLDRVAARMWAPFVPRAGAKTSKAVQERFSRFTVMSPGDQGSGRSTPPPTSGR
jgi:hypothetical protein